MSFSLFGGGKPEKDPEPVVTAPKGISSTAVNKLSLMQDQFLNFERQMEDETRSRRAAEDSKLTTARDTLQRLDKTLSAEVKRRVEANKALQEMFESQVLLVQQKLESGFEERLDRVEDAMNALSDRVGIIERDFAIERDRYVRDIEDKNAFVAKDVNSLQTAFENERLVRAEKEAIIVKRLADIEAKADERIETSKVTIDNRILQIRAEMEDIYRVNSSGEDKFEKFALEEIASLKNSLLMESQSREAADDDLVNALNHYTKALQDALRIINSV